MVHIALPRASVRFLMSPGSKANSRRQPAVLWDSPPPTIKGTAMRRVSFGLLAFTTLCLGASTAAAEDDLPRPVGPFIGTTKGYVMVDPPSDEDVAHHFSNVLFLNRCAGGCTVACGTDNSSSVPDRSGVSCTTGGGSLPAFSRGDN